MSKKVKAALWEASKEPLRILVLAVIPVLIAYFKEIPFEWAGLAILVLRTIDKVLHEVGKAKKDGELELGLTRF